MKNSDMKVIAIILSIALFFTIITSNAVSIASVVLLALDGTGAQTEAPAGEQGDQSSQTSNQPSNQVNSNNTQTNNTTNNTQNNTQTNNTQTNNTQNNTTNNNTSADNNANNNATATDDNPIAKDPLAAYQKAAKDIHDNGSAAYNKIGWQTPLKIEGLGILDSIIVPILESFMTTEDEAEVKVNAKGSDDAKNRMPISNCTADTVKSATAEKLDNGNYKVVIVMKEEVNPSYQDTNGIAVMSREFLDYKDVEKEAANIAVVKSLEGEIKYVDYTITAEMTADGKFVSITHYGIGYIKANLNGSINASGELEFNAKYTDFVY